MSYDFHLVPQSTTSAQIEAVNQDDEINPGPPVPEKEKQKKKLAYLLIESNPKLEIFLFEFSEIAKTYNWTEDEARIRFRHIELNGPDDSDGIQITLYDDRADVTIPYWHQPRAAEIVFDEVWRYLKIFAEHGGFSVYDPQLDRILNLTSDRDEVLKRYGGIVAKMPEIIEGGKPYKKAWWKFW
jgi:hypothetical protein